MVADERIKQYRGSYVQIHYGPDWHYAGTMLEYDLDTNNVVVENKGATILISLDTAISIMCPKVHANNSFHPAHRR